MLVEAYVGVQCKTLGPTRITTLQGGGLGLTI